MGRQVFTSLGALLAALLLIAPGPGDRLVEVYGDLATARRVAIVVPGADTTAANFHKRAGKPYKSPGGGARTVLEQARLIDPAERVATIGWLGYDSPRTIGLGTLTDRPAIVGAAALRRTVADVRARAPHASITLLCHSYGSVVCAKALPGLPVGDVIVYGSPGLGVDRAAELGSPARLWAGRTSDDWIKNVPQVRFGGLGFGTDPTDPRFGARVFEAGPGGHSDYLKPGGASLRNITLIVLGRHDEVTYAGDPPPAPAAQQTRAPGDPHPSPTRNGHGEANHEANHVE